MLIFAHFLATDDMVGAFSGLSMRGCCRKSLLINFLKIFDACQSFKSPTTAAIGPD
jgi:hypothetical protein